MAQENKTKNAWWLLGLSVVVVITLWAANWFFSWVFLDTYEQRSWFGGTFGAVSALFSGLAFAFLIYTIWLQREELRLQREELRLQREALEKQAKELERQADAIWKSAELQRESFALQEKQFEHAKTQDAENRERLIKARFVQFGDVVVRQSGGMEIICKLKNLGAMAVGIRVKGDAELKNPVEPLNVAADGELTLVWNVDPAVPPDSLRFKMSFRDTLGKKQKQAFVIEKDPNAKSEEDTYRIIDD